MRLSTTLPGGLAERAYEDKELLEFKKAFDADAKLVTATIGRLERTAEYRDGARRIWKDHSAKPKALRSRRRPGNMHTPVWHAARNSLVCKECGSFSRSGAGFFVNADSKCVFEGEVSGRKLTPTHSLIRIEESDTRIPALLCKK